MLSQLVYVSTRRANCTENEIEQILKSCEKNNPALNITGILLYSEKKFIQLVEGDFKILNMLYNKIKQDTRHENCMIISLGPIKQKAFPSWHMGARKIAGSEVDFKTSISDEDKVLFQNLLKGSEEKNGERVLSLLKKFF